MSIRFDASRAPPIPGEPQLTAFAGRDADTCSPPGAGKEDCARILTELNEEAARYCALATALGTNIDGDKLRRKLKLSRVRAWERANDAKNKLIPLLRRKKLRMEDCEDLERMYRALFDIHSSPQKKKLRMEDCEDLERMYRVLSACLEFLEQQYYITFLVQTDFCVCPGEIESIFIQTGISESYLPKKAPHKQPGSDDHSLVTNLSLRSMGSSDLKNQDREDIAGLEKEITDLHELVYTMNQSIAIQSWEVDPDLETDKFTVAVDGMESSARNSENIETGSMDQEHGRLRCVSVIILTIIVVLIGGIVGILMGVLD